FSPSTPITPGNSAVDVVMSISTSKSSSSSQFRVLAILLLPGLLVAGGIRTRNPRRTMRIFLAAVASFFLILLISCAGLSAGGGGGGTQNPLAYKITVTGTSPGTVPDPGQSTVVTLVVD